MSLSGAAAMTGNLITGNVVRNYGDSTTGNGYGILLLTNAYANVTNNTIDVEDNVIGLQLQNFFNNGSMTWSGNDVTVGQDAIGILSNLFYASNATLNIQSNTVHAATGVTGASDFTWGVYVLSTQVGSTVNVTNNTIGATGGQFARGVYLWNNPTAVPVTVSGGTIGNSDVGVDLQAIDPFFNAGAATSVVVQNVAITGGAVGVRLRNNQVGANVPNGNLSLSLSGTTISGATTGILVEDGTVDAFTTALTIGAGNSITGGTTGLRVDGAQADIAGNALNNISFTGQSGNYITLANGAEDNNEINGTAASFGGLTGGVATLAQNYAIEDKITHAIDDAAQGFIRVRASNVFVTPNSFSTPATTTASIQRGIDVSANGNTVNIQAGSYTGGADATAPGLGITLALGASPAQVIVAGNLVLNTGDTLTIEVDGTSAATQYDNFVVTGNVTLGGATLNLLQSPDSAYTPVPGDVFTIINNDTSVDAVSGTFNGLANGATIVLNGQTLEVYYVGNDGNDVILAHQTPNTAYVDDSWGALLPGDFIADADLGTTGNQSAVFGLNAFLTINTALTSLPTNGIVIINGGTYAETVSVTGTRTLEITGPDAAQAVTIDDLANIAGTFLVLEGSSTLTFGDADSRTLAGVISGSGNLTKQGAGIATISGANTYGGITTINGGTISINTDAALGAIPGVATPGKIVINGATLRASAAVTLNANRGIALTPAGGTIIANSGNFQINGIIANQTTAAALTVGSGGGIYVPGSQSTYSGGTTFASGSTTVPVVSSTGPAGAPTSGPLGTGTITFAGGSFRSTTSTAITVANNITFNANTIIPTGSASDKVLTLTGAMTLTGNRTLTVNSVANVVIAGVIGGGAFDFTKAGPGTLVMSATNTYTGATNINAGVLSFTGSGATSTSSTINVNNTGTLRFGRNDTWGNHTSDVSSPIIINAGGTVESGGFYNTLVNLTMNGGVLALTGGVNTTFPAFALKGTVTVGGSQASQINVVSGSNNLINVGDDTLGATVFDVADSTGNTNADLVVNAPLQNNAFGGIGITKTGVGTMSLTAVNTYGGPTTVNAGTLLVNGTNSGTGAVNVNNSAILGGTGTIAGPVNVNNTARLAPGVSPETLATGNLTLVSGTFFDVEIGGTSPGNGVTGYDQVIVTGTVDLGNATLNLIQFGGFIVNNGVPQTFTIIDNDGSADAVTGTFNGLAEGASISYAGGQVFISYAGGDGNDVVLYSTPTINGSPAADTLVLRQVSGNPALVEYSLNATPFVQVTSAFPFTFNGLGGTDLMLVDTSNGDPISTGNTFFSGEMLRIEKSTGAASDTATYVPSTTGGAGLVTLAGFGDVNFTGTSNVDFVNLTTVNVQTATLNDTLSLGDSNTATNLGSVPGGYSIAAAADLAITGANAIVGLRNVTNSNLSTITGGGDGNDAVTINTSTGAHGLTNLAIATGSGADTVTVAGALTVGGNINIASQNIAVNGTLTGGATSTVTLNAGTGAITTGGAGLDVIARDLLATATTGIDLDTTVLNITATNSGSGSIIIDETNGANVLNVSAANGSATVTSATGNLNVTTVSASTSVTLTATAGSITDANAAANNVTAGSLTATAATGIDLDTTITTLTSANVTGIGAIDINDLAGGLIVTSATTNDGAITLNATGGDLTLTSVIAGGTGRDITATTTTSGNILVALVDASGDNLSLTAAAGGAINESAADGTADLIAATATLAGPAGIGNLGTIEVNFTTLTSATTTGANAAIDLSDLAGGLVVTTATTADGAITLNATGGDLTLTTVTAAGTARNITATTTTSGNVLAGNVTAAGDTITVNSAGAIEELGADPAADLTANILLLTAVSGIGAAGQLEVDGGTTAGTGLTASVTGAGLIDIVDVNGLRVNSAITNSGDINLVGANGNLTLTLVTAGGSGFITASTLAGTGTIELGALTALGDSVTLSAFTDITDINGAAVNVSAASLTATAATGIGSGNAIETSIDTLTATNATANNIEIAETDAITLASVVQSIDNNANDISVTAGGTITVGVVNAGTTAGDVTLTATAGSIIDDAGDITADVIGDVVIMTAASGVGQSGGNGPLDTTANSLDVSVTAAGLINLLETDAVTLTDIDTANGAITIVAGGTITATDVQSLTDVDANDISLTATAGNIAAGLISAGTTAGDVTLLANVGSIVDATGDAGADVIGDVVTMTAATGVGESAGNGSLDTSANSLDVSVTTAGLINLNETDAVTLTDIDTFNGPITIVSGGTMTATDVASLNDIDANDITLTTTAGSIAVGTILAGAAGDAFLTAAAALTDIDATNPDITADDIVLLATTGIGAGDPLETVASNLEASGGTGGVFVANTGSLTIGLIGATMGLSATGGDIVVTTTGGMTIAENVTATGAGTDVTLAAIDAASAGQNIVLNNLVTVSSAAASVTLNAGDNATITGNITSGTTTNINVDFGDAESVGTTEAVSGGLLNITGVITTPVVGSGGGAFLAGNDDFDTFTFNPQTTTEFRLLGGLPISTVTGDTLVMDVTGTANPNLTVPGSLAPYTGDGSGAWSFTSAHRPVLFASIEQSTITGNYHLTYDNSVSPVGNLFVMRDASQANVQLRNGSTAGPVVFQGSLAVILSLRVLGSSGNDIVTVDDINTLPNFSGTVPLVTDNGNIPGTAEFLFDGLGGSDTLVYNINGATA
jgi:autotransporter-associated beta strand protein